MKSPSDFRLSSRVLAAVCLRIVMKIPEFCIKVSEKIHSYYAYLEARYNSHNGKSHLEYNHSVSLRRMYHSFLLCLNRS